MKSLFSLAAGAAALLASASALAASPDTLLGGAADLQVLKLSSSAAGQIAGTVLGLARTWIPFCLVLALVLEAFGSPTRPRDYSAVLWRGLVIVILLAPNPAGSGSVYGFVFGSIKATASGIASRVTPDDPWAKLSVAAIEQMRLTFNQAEKTNAADNPSGSVSGVLNAFGGAGLEAVGNYFFTGALSLILLVCQAIHWLVGSLASVISTLFFILGPLALVFGIPRASGTVGRWLTSYITVACWPIISSILLAIVASIGADAFKTAGVFGTLCAAFLMAACSLATPIIASSIVGGAIGDVVSPAVRTLASTATAATAGVVSAAGSVTSGAVSGTSAASTAASAAPLPTNAPHA